MLSRGIGVHHGGLLPILKASSAKLQSIISKQLFISTIDYNIISKNQQWVTAELPFVVLIEYNGKGRENHNRVVMNSSTRYRCTHGGSSMAQYKHVSCTVPFNVNQCTKYDIIVFKSLHDGIPTPFPTCFGRYCCCCARCLH